MDTQAQSEARRRKILENADARLRKIAEIQSSSSDKKKKVKKTETDKTSDTEENLICEERGDVGGGGERAQSGEAEWRDPVLVKMLESVLAEDSDQSREDDEEDKDSPLMVYSAVAVLAVIVRVLYSLKFSWIYGQLMWVPFVVVIIPLVAEPVVRRCSDAPGGLLVSFLLVNRVSPQVVSTVVYLVSVIQHLLKLFSFYLFTFLITHFVMPEPA